MDSIRQYISSCKQIQMKVAEQQKMRVLRLASYFDRIDDGMPHDFPLLFCQPTEGYPLSLHKHQDCKFKHLQQALTQLQQKRKSKEAPKKKKK